jgi:Sec-independent protein translocase protein TatA
VFNFSGSEIIFLLLAGLVVLGPERLPGLIRQVGKVYGDIRRTTQGLERELRDTFDEPMKDLRSTADSIRSGFGEIDTEPSPPMRTEMSQPLITENLDSIPAVAPQKDSSNE